MLALFSLCNSKDSLTVNARVVTDDGVGDLGSSGKAGESSDSGKELHGEGWLEEVELVVDCLEL